MMPSMLKLTNITNGLRMITMVGRIKKLPVLRSVGKKPMRNIASQRTSKVLLPNLRRKEQK